jgi:hypothetical protein
MCRLEPRAPRSQRAAALALQPLQTRAVLVQLHVSKELEHVYEEVLREKRDFESAFRKWAAKMEKLTLAKKLHADWIPQMNVERGESYFFNVRTGESSEEHPNMKEVRKTEKKQRNLIDHVVDIVGALRDDRDDAVQYKVVQTMGAILQSTDVCRLSEGSLLLAVTCSMGVMVTSSAPRGRARASRRVRMH